MPNRSFLCHSAGAIAALAAALNAAATTGIAFTTPYDTGRFLSVNGEVYAGLFSSHVKIDSLTVGEATYLAQLDELIEVAAVRVYAAHGSHGAWERLSDEQVLNGEFGVSLGLGRDVDPATVTTVLDAMQGLDLARMLYTDGSRRVRVDVLLAVPLRDSSPGEPDFSPEALVLGSFTSHQVGVAAIIGGNVDQPILAVGAVRIEPTDFDQGRTGIAMETARIEAPQPITILGLDLSSLGIGDDTPAIGFRIEIEPGEPAVFNLCGVGREWQRDLATPMAMLNDAESLAGGFGMGTLAGWEAMGGWGGGTMAMSQPFSQFSFGGGGGFRGGGGGGGGGPAIPPFIDDDDDDGGDDRSGDPPVPAPGTLMIVLSSMLGLRRRRNRSNETRSSAR